MFDILEVQQRFMDAGYQWVERIYNDGRSSNCSIKFMKDTDCHGFTEGNHLLGDFGWGRFTRNHCWAQAEAWLDEHYPKLKPEVNTAIQETIMDLRNEDLP